MTARLGCFFICCVLLGCGQSTVLDGLNEAEANDLQLRLLRSGIRANKRPSGGGRFAIDVAEARWDAAWSSARRGGFPRPAVRAQTRLVMGPTEVQEAARARTQSQLERQISLHDGVTTVVVSVGAAGTSATIRHRPDVQLDHAVFDRLIRTTVSTAPDYPIELSLLADPAELRPPDVSSPAYWKGGLLLGFAALCFGLFFRSRRRVAYK